MSVLSDLQRDILVKAAEGIQEGMWCRGLAFRWDNGEALDSFAYGASAFGHPESLLSQAHRCASGEIALRTIQMKGSVHDYGAAMEAVANALTSCTVDDHLESHDPSQRVLCHNDICLQGFDGFSAGQEWSRIFREVAES